MPTWPPTALLIVASTMALTDLYLLTTPGSPCPARAQQGHAQDGQISGWVQTRRFQRSALHLTLRSAQMVPSGRCHQGRLVRGKR